LALSFKQRQRFFVAALQKPQSPFTDRHVQAEYSGFLVEAWSSLKGTK